MAKKEVHIGVHRLMHRDITSLGPLSMPSHASGWWDMQ